MNHLQAVQDFIRIPPLFESELFGYEKGAFTGAVTRKKGLVETADGGTLFLDEMGDVPLTMQVKLLRLIESCTVRRVGSIETQQSNFRLVAATHKPLQQMVADGRFRQDLYYRISAFSIHLPPLRERVEDIPMLVDSFLQRGGATKHRVSVEAAAMARLQAHDWPGNIRELRNVLDRAPAMHPRARPIRVCRPTGRAGSSALATDRPSTAQGACSRTSLHRLTWRFRLIALPALRVA